MGWAEAGAPAVDPGVPVIVAGVAPVSEEVRPVDKFRPITRNSSGMLGVCGEKAGSPAGDVSSGPRSPDEIRRPPCIRPSKNTLCADAAGQDAEKSRNQMQHCAKLTLARCASVSSGSVASNAAVSASSHA